MGWPVSDGSQQPAGEAEVAAAMVRLAALDDLPLAEHVTVFEDVHRLLQDALAVLDGS